ncbi:MAG: ABC transporter ATP-binding protein [Pseudomonadota bacterium]
MSALQIQGLSKQYPNGPRALQQIDLAVEAGDFFALLGPNGAGKSTLISIICSLLNKSGGSVKIFGHDLDQAPETAKSLLGLVPQEFNFNVFEPVLTIVANQAGYYGIPRRRALARTETVLKQLHLWDKRHTQARSLSGGMKRRLMIARALVHEPRLLILDEPTAGVDIEIRRSMWDFLREINQQGTTIILTTHYLEEAESLCRHIAIINQGRIVECAPMADLLSQLTQETLVLDTAEALTQMPELNDFSLQQVASHSLEVTVSRQQGLSTLFAGLKAAGIEVVSLRNKQNRLEQLMMDRVQQVAA